ncbi:hypothetical protein BDR07DRAFT_1433028, partial [Suillus spraguei]
AYISLALILVFTRYCNRMRPSNGCSRFRNNALTRYMAHIHLWPPQSDPIQTPQTSVHCKVRLRARLSTTNHNGTTTVGNHLYTYPNTYPAPSSPQVESDIHLTQDL